MSEKIVAMLNELAGLKSAGDAIRLAKAEAVEKSIPAELREAVEQYRKLVADVEAEFADTEKAAAENAAGLEEAVKEAVKAHGATVKGDYLQAVFAKGRVSWDTSALEGFVAAHPELAQFRKVGDPSVSLRKIYGCGQYSSGLTTSANF